MKNLSISIQGEFSDSFIYSGLLVLVDFDSSIRIINWQNFLDNRLKKESNETIQSYKKIFFDKKDIRKIDDNLKIPRNLDVDFCDLDEFMIAHIPLKYWPTNINIFSNHIYLSSDNGLSYLSFNGDKRFSESSFSKKEEILFNGCKIFSFGMDNSRTILCAGNQGCIYSYLENRKKLNILGDNKESDWIDCQWYEKDLDTNLGITSSTDIKVQAFKNINSINERINTLQKKIHNNKAYKNKNRHLIKIKDLRDEVKKCLESDFSSRNFNKYIMKEKTTSYVKKRFSKLGLFSEINNNISIEKDGVIKHVIKADDEIVNWRVFPQAKTHMNQLHFIENNFIKIIGFEL